MPPSSPVSSGEAQVVLEVVHCWDNAMVLLDENTGRVLTSRSDEAGTTPLPLLDVGDMFDHGID